ncbi:glycosyltransferase family 4 protein [Methanolobus sp. WCC4]|uniref:glycosyltransferase family 4 protein n=1 Tax=Methanolobus sp. WCC4 TaxID=3125784 RepID=UPI0030F92007
MKIAQVCHRYHPFIGGVETHVKEISERMVLLGNEVEVLTTDLGGKLPQTEMLNGVKITRFRSFAPGEAYYLSPMIYFYLKSNGYDVVHAHNYHALPAFFAGMGKGRCKFVFTPHYHRGGHTFLRNLLHKPYKLFGKMIFSRADNIVCVSEYEKGLVSEDFVLPPGKIRKIPNGINLAEFRNVRLDLKKGDGNKLLYVGRLEEYKGVQYIIQALLYLPDHSLSVIGKGPFEHDLRELADKLGVASKVEWLKDVSRKELLKHYVSADVFLMLSKHEAYGITVAEALASGTLCIVALGSALDEFVDDEMCFGIDDYDPRILSSIIKRLKYNDTVPNTIADWNDVVHELVDLYEE